MDFTREEQRILLQALYRLRGDVSGASQSEQNKYALVEEVIAKIEDESGPLTPQRTRFDREMEENLSVLSRGGEWPPSAELDKEASAPKVESKAGRPAAKAAAKAAAGKPAAARKPAAAKKAGPARKSGTSKEAKRAGAPKAGGAKGARASGAAKR